MDTRTVPCDRTLGHEIISIFLSINLSETSDWPKVSLASDNDYSNQF